MSHVNCPSPCRTHTLSHFPPVFIRTHDQPPHCDRISSFCLSGLSLRNLPLQVLYFQSKASLSDTLPTHNKMTLKQAHCALRQSVNIWSRSAGRSETKEAARLLPQNCYKIADRNKRMTSLCFELGEQFTYDICKHVIPLNPLSPVTVTLFQLISIILCFWGPSSPSDCRHNLWMGTWT